MFAMLCNSVGITACVLPCCVTACGVCHVLQLVVFAMCYSLWCLPCCVTACGVCCVVLQLVGFAMLCNSVCVTQLVFCHVVLL